MEIYDGEMAGGKEGEERAGNYMGQDRTGQDRSLQIVKNTELST